MNDALSRSWTPPVTHSVDSRFPAFGAPAALRTLLLEDQPADAELIFRQLKEMSYTVYGQRVETEREFADALGPEVDLILADYQLPGYNALLALQLVRERRIEAPFIIVSGHLGEELAVAAMQHGAADVVNKDRLRRLGPAVKRALEQRRLAGENRRAAAALRRTEDLSNRIASLAAGLRQVAPLYEKLVALARDLAVTPEQAAAVDAAEAPVREYLESRLGELMAALMELPGTGNSPAVKATPDSEQIRLLQAVLKETIVVLQQTKRSFKSRSLGQLREKLEQVLSLQP